MEETILYCFDSTMFIEIHRYYARLVPELYNELDQLFLEHRIISHKIVYDELTTYSKQQDQLSKWIKSKRDYFKDITEFQALRVSDIVTKFPLLISYKSEKEQADPWLIALVIEEQQKNSQQMFPVYQDIVMVSDESIHKTSKIPAVCKHYNIHHYDPFEFFQMNGWNFNLSKTSD